MRAVKLIRFSDFGISDGMERNLHGIQKLHHLRTDLESIQDCGRRFSNGIKLTEGSLVRLFVELDGCSMVLGVSNV